MQTPPTQSAPQALTPGLTPTQRQQALRVVADLAEHAGMPEAVYVAEHGVTVIANRVTAARWSGFPTLRVGGVDVALFVQAVQPLDVAL